MKKFSAMFSRVFVLIAFAVFQSAFLRAAETDAKTHAALGVWDSATPSAQSIAPAAIAAKEGWTAIAAGQTPATFAGDAVLGNSHYTAVLRKQSAAVELYSAGADGPVLRAKLVLVAPDGHAAAALDHAAVVENSKGAVAVEAFYKTDSGAALSARFQLKKGGVALEAEPGSGAAKMRVECPTRFAILPDFFADDIVINPQKIKPNEIEIPSENFLLQMLGNGDAIVMTVFESRQQDAKLQLEGDGEKRQIAAAEIDFGSPKTDAPDAKKGNKIWVSVFEGPHIWHTLDVKKADAGKVLPLDWKMPNASVWRVDFTRPNELTDSWSMLLQEKADAQYIKPSWLGGGDGKIDTNRKRWNTVLGTFAYPAWSDPEGRGFLQPLKNDELSFAGPVVIYPIARVEKTPVDRFTVFDVIRNSLGVGPCEYILDLEGQKSEYKGRATCSTRDTLAAIYKNNQQKEQRAKVDKTLDDALTFCTHIRGRINRYMEFGHKMRDYLAEQKKAHPELSAYIDEMDKLTQEIETRYNARKEKIRTLEYVAQLNANFRKDVLDDTTPEALAKCKKYGKDLVEVGDNQDELSSECRWVVKSLRQSAGLLLAIDPKAAPIANEIRARTQEALKNPANHEGAQH